MSLYAALFGGVSGLKSYSSALGVISDNITNVNTTGYKSTKMHFSTLVTESSNASAYSPGGVRGVPQTLVSNQGLLQSSSSATDLGVDGAGFFVVRTNSNQGTGTSTVLFTRAGNFTPDEQGFLKNSANLYLQGWQLDSAGGIPTNLGDLTTLVPINISGLTGTAEATENVRLRANLQSSQPLNPLMGGYLAGDFASGAVSADFERTIQVYDAQGGTHTLVLAAAKVAANEWRAEIYASPASDVNTLIHPNGLLTSGTLAFNSNGSLNIGGLAPVTSAALVSPFTTNWVNGASPSDLTFNFGSDAAVDGFTQFDSVSTLISSNVDGAVFGNVTGVSIGKEGVVTALFDNGLTRNVFKLPVATFQNPDGLTRRQGNAYAVSDQSGNFSLVEPGTGGGGFIAPSALEASTVDLANEFAALITVQRAFSASTKVITTADQMLDELNRIR